jgi:pyridoxamine 5'-phosphate oxidase
MRLTVAVDLARMRAEYAARGLDVADADPDPLRQFQRWLAEAVAARVTEPNAMVLSTVDGDGRPWARHVLLKDLSGSGFTFYTNYASRKARHLAADPRAALTFAWLGLHRQVCITGTVDRLDAADSDRYFAQRPRGAQLGAWASAQSSELADRAELEARVAEYDARFADGPVPRPEHWGGYRLHPDEIEFWQGRPDRLHDRVRYVRVAADRWDRSRLAP